MQMPPAWCAGITTSPPQPPGSPTWRRDLPDAVAALKRRTALPPRAGPGTEVLERYLKAAIEQRLYSNARNLRRHLAYLFADIDLRDKQVLDIGGGAGLLATYAAVCGARGAVC